MAIKTLEQLKEENAKAEAEANQDPQPDDAETDAGEAKDQLEAEESADTDSEGESESEVEPWMLTGEEESSDTGDGSHDQERKFTDSDVAAARRNMRAKLERKHEKRESELLARIEKLENERGNTAAQPAQGKAAKPKRDDFDDDEQFFDALADWKIATNDASRHASAQKDEQDRAVRQYEDTVNAAVEQHYERAVDLADKSKISADMYKSADLKVREMADDVFPGAGDAIVDTLIYNLGEGSEKVMYNIGVNTKRRDHVRKLLQEDKTGLRASAYLGKLNGELSSPGKRKSKAPTPAANPAGDSKTSESFRALKRKYKDAHKRGDTQTAFNARREARQAGADVTDW